MSEKVDKKKFNLSMPPAMAEAFEESAERFGPKRRWIACASAVYLWLNTPRDEQNKLEDLMMSADARPEKMAEIIAAMAGTAKRRVGSTAQKAQTEGIPGTPGLQLPESAHDAPKGKRPAQSK